MFWKIIYIIYPPILRVLEALHFHNKRQEFLLGMLGLKCTPQDFQKFLVEKGFFKAILAWQDPGEVLSLRKIDNKKFQYHIRLFNDREIRGHYEFSSERNPFKHIFNIGFQDRRDYIKSLVDDYLA